MKLGFIEIKKEEKRKEVGTPATVAACLLTTVMAGYFSLHLSNVDEGKVVSLQEMQARVAVEADRIKNNPNMPEQAKKIALSHLETAHNRHL